MLFPRLRGTAAAVTSTFDPKYNCIAFAYGITDRWVWPWPSNTCWWPDDVPRRLDVDAFRVLFERIGYRVCSDGRLERGYERVALYSRAGETTHAARQLPNGEWTSKLGNLEDIRHSGEADVESDDYGTVALFLRRRTGGHRRWWDRLADFLALIESPRHRRRK